MVIAFLGAACSMGDSDGKDTSGAVDVAALKEKPQDVEGSFSREAPPLTDQQLVEGSATEVEGHPDLQQAEKVNRKLVVPKTVEGKWKAVKILVRDKTDEEKNEMKTVTLGDSFPLGTSGITVTTGAFLPNFVLTGDEVTSKGNELQNPAVRLVITENGNLIFDGWAFAMYPAMYAFEHPRYSLQLMDFIPESVG
ncbi:DUF2155 domain-containing protein [Nitrospina gracilis]|uniref:DUF2155 domain-containing protein n=1 Tax=Nitrospina gracilis TaxID=35801 RepID=UPI001F38AEA2|nr:DUF2155 domain-containing protein [Nitrospina gracilis]MCF8719143.1 hypothetical protein [Nitrospina gracilis Nb-211]